MNPHSHGERLLFLCTDADLMDLEWILPVADHCARQGFVPELLTVFPPRQDLQRFFLRFGMEILPSVNATLDRFDPLPRFPLAWLRGWSSLGGTLGRPPALYLTLGNPWALKSGLDGWRRRHLKARLLPWMQGFRAIFMPHRSPFVPTPTAENLLVELALQAGPPLVGYPPAVSQLHFKASVLMPYDLLLVTDPAHAEGLRSQLPGEVLAVGGPKFASSWRGRVQRAYAAAHPDLARRMPEGEAVLAILKNDTSPIWKGKDFFATTRSMLDQLRESGRFLVVKPHPRQRPGPLAQVLDGLPKPSYLLDYGPLAYWAARCPVCVSLFSGGVLDPLAEGHVPYVYWPVDDALEQAVDAGGFPEHYLRRTETGGIFNQFEPYAVVLQERRLSLPVVDPAPYVERFERVFLPERGVEGLGEALHRLPRRSRLV